MSAEEENVPMTVESGAADAAVTTPASEKKPATKGAKAKKTKEVKAKKPVTKAPRKKSSSSHPPYEEVWFVCLCSLRFRSMYLFFEIRFSDSRDLDSDCVVVIGNRCTDD